MQHTLMSANSFFESFSSSSSFTQVSQSFGFAPMCLLLDIPGVPPACWKISSNCCSNCNRYRLLSRNDRRTMAVETTKSKKRVDKNVNLQNVSLLLRSLRRRDAGRTDKVRKTLAGRYYHRCRLTRGCSLGEEKRFPGGLGRSTTWVRLTQVVAVDQWITPAGRSVQHKPLRALHVIGHHRVT